MNKREIRPLTNEIDLKGIDTLPVSRKFFIQAKNSQKMALNEFETGCEQVYLILKLAEINSGLKKFEDADMQVLAKQTFDLITDRYPAVTLDEFKNICRLGVIGTYGDWYGMCLKSVNQWIKGYFSDPEYIAAVKEWNKSIDNELIKTSEVPVFIKVERSKQGIKNLFQRYRETGKMDMSAFAYYDILADLIGEPYKGVKTLITDPEARKNIMAECRTKLEKSFKSEKVRAEKRGDFTQAELIAEILSNLDAEGQLHRMVKERFLTIYFDYLIKDNKQLDI